MIPHPHKGVRHDRAIRRFTVRQPHPGGVHVIAGFGFVLGFFTNTGSGIGNHPWEGHLSAPGARLPDEFHQFADRQIHDADLRAAHMRLSDEHGYDMTIDEVNRRLAEESAARKAARCARARRGAHQRRDRRSPLGSRAAGAERRRRARRRRRVRARRRDRAGARGARRARSRSPTSTATRPRRSPRRSAAARWASRPTSRTRTR